MQKGTVKWFNPTKGYGFIKPSSGDKDVFVHISAVERAGLRTLNEGQEVEYELVTNRGRTSAENLKVAYELPGGSAGSYSPRVKKPGGFFFDADLLRSKPERQSKNHAPRFSAPCSMSEGARRTRPSATARSACG